MTSFIFHVDIEGGTHDVPCCKHAIDYGTAEGRHDTKTDEDNGRHQLGEKREQGGSLPKNSLGRSQRPGDVWAAWPDHHGSTSTSQCLSHILTTHVGHSVGSAPRDTRGNRCMKYTLCLTSAHPAAMCLIYMSIYEYLPWAFNITRFICNWSWPAGPLRCIWPQATKCVPMFKLSAIEIPNAIHYKNIWVHKWGFL